MDINFALSNEEVATRTEAPALQGEVSNGLWIARYCTLEELLGLVFGVMTVAWIVLSLTGLAL